MSEIFSCLLAGMSVGFNAVLSALKFYQQLSGIKEQIIATIFGVPAIIISIFFIAFAVLKFLFKKL